MTPKSGGGNTLPADGSAARQMRALRQRVEGSERRQEILDSVTAIFLKEGFRAVAMTDLVTSARCSRRTLYEIAPTKEQLFLLVIDSLWRRVGEQARTAALLDPDPVERIRIFLTKSSEVFNPPLATLLADVNASPPARRLFDDYVDDVFGFLVDIIGAGVAGGQFRAVDTRIAAEMLVAAGARITEQSWEGEVDDREALLVAIDVILGGLVAPDRRQRAGTRK